MDKRDDQSFPTTRINVDRASRVLGVDAIFKTKLMSCLMALYQDSVLAGEAYNEILQDAYETLQEHRPKEQDFLGSPSVRERSSSGDEQH